MSSACLVGLEDLVEVARSKGKFSCYGNGQNGKDVLDFVDLIYKALHDGHTVEEGHYAHYQSPNQKSSQ